MDTVETSLVVLGEGSILTSTFDRPVSVIGKQIAVKSIAFSEYDTFNKSTRYKVRVVDSKGVIHTLTLPPNQWIQSNNLLQAIFDEFNNLYLRLRNSNQSYLIDELNFRNISGPYISIRHDFQATAIHYGNSGLTIKSDGFYPDEDNVFSLFEAKASRSNENRFAYMPHVLNQPKVSVPKNKIPAILLCDAIKPTYLGGSKRRVLDVVHFPGSTDNDKTITNALANFHDFSVDTLMTITFCFQTLQGTLFNFIGPVVIHLIVK